MPSCTSGRSLRNLAASTALPQPPKTSQKVPRNSAPSLALSGVSCMPISSTSSECGSGSVASIEGLCTGARTLAVSWNRKSRRNPQVGDEAKPSRASRRSPATRRADRREGDVAGRLGVDLGDLQPRSAGPTRPVDLSAAGHEDRSAPALSGLPPRPRRGSARASTPSPRHIRSRVTTIVVRPGSGRPIESYVFRPMISTWPMVRLLNRCQSSGIRQGMSSPAPITPLRATAAIADDLGHRPRPRSGP